MSKSPWNLDEVEKRLHQTKEVLPAEIANVSQSYFESSWRKQGYDGKKWKEVQRRIPGTKAYKYPKTKGLGRKTRAILVRSGRLRRSFHVLSKRWDNITIANSAPYARYNNEGGKNLPQRQFMGQTNELGQKQIRIINKAFDDIWR